MSMIRVSTKKIITPKAPSTSLEVQYPHTTLSLSLTSSNLETARSALRKGISDNAINLDVAKTFLYYFAGTVKTTLPDAWSSYGVVIGEAESEITPRSLLDIRATVKAQEHGSTTQVSEKDDPLMAGYVLSIYRLIRATLGDYKTKIAERVSTQLKAITSSAPQVTDVVDIYKSWASDKGYNMLLAAFDMFFHKFPLHELANLRIGTTGSRHRDCAALLAYGYLGKLLGMDKMTDVMDWVFLEQIGADIDRMMTSEDELLDPYSYFPYHVDLGLVVKTAYSASANPHFFEWTQIIGSLLRSPRSMHAKHICEFRVLDILANASCVAYAYANTFAFTKVYRDVGDEIEEGKEGEED